MGLALNDAKIKIWKYYGKFSFFDSWNIFVNMLRSIYSNTRYFKKIFIIFLLTHGSEKIIFKRRYQHFV